MTDYRRCIICWRRKASLFNIIIDNSDGKSVTKYWNDDHPDTEGQAVDDDRLPKVFRMRPFRKI